MDPKKRNDGTATNDLKSTSKDTRLMPTAAAPVGAAEESTTTPLPSVATTATFASRDAKEETTAASSDTANEIPRASKFPAVPTNQALKQGNSKGKKMNEVTQKEVSFPLHAAPPMDSDDDKYENEIDNGMREEEIRKQNDNDRPGAFQVAGINPSQISQQSFVYSDQGAIALEEEKENMDEVLATSNVVAEAVDEDQLLDELLSRRRHDVVNAENIVTVEDGHSDGEKGNRRGLAINKRTIACATTVLVIVVVAVVVIAVLVSKSNRAPATSQSNSSQASALQAFRTVLLNHNVSSSQDLEQYGTPQNEALNWLVNIDTFLNESSTVESIIDRYVLAVVYYSDDGVQWINQSDFLSSSSICAWHNVTTGAFCTTAMNVSHGSNGTDDFILTTLALGNNNLIGAIPSEMGKLISLTYLDLDGTDNQQITGTIPTGLGELTNLNLLKIENNGLIGTIPTELGQMSGLVELYLQFNQLSGTIPTELTDLSLLAVLDLGENTIHGTIPTELGRLRSLTVLQLYFNQLSRTLPTELGLLVNLSILNLHNNNLTGEIPTELGQLSRLTHLDLSFNNLSGVVPTLLADLVNLQQLYLHNNTNLTGNLTALFCNNDNNWTDLQADCQSGGHVECSCCTCCSPHCFNNEGMT